MLKKKYLNSHKKARKYLNQVINEFRMEDKPDVSKYRALTYMLKTLLSYFEFGKELEIEKRVESIERRLIKYNAKFFKED